MIRKDLYDICQAWLQEAGNTDHRGFIVLNRKYGEDHKKYIDIITNIPGRLIGAHGILAAKYIEKLTAAEYDECQVNIIEADGIAY